MRAKFINEEVFKPKSGADIQRDIKQREQRYEEIESLIEDQFGDRLLRIKIKNDLVKFRVDMDAYGYNWDSTDFEYDLSDKSLMALSDVPGGELFKDNVEIEDIEQAVENLGHWSDEEDDEDIDEAYEPKDLIFYDKVLKDHPILGSKLPKEQQYKSTTNRNPYIGRGRSWQGNAILPLGKVDLRTGECPIFNVYDTWEPDSTVEVWVDPKGHDYTHLQGVEAPSSGISSILKPKPKEEIDLTKRKFFNYRLIFTSGSQPSYQIGQKQNFYHDQNGNNIGQWQMVDYVPLKWMRELILPYGGHIAGYVYK